MKTYIRQNIPGFYVEFQEEIDAEYWDGKIGSTYEDFLNGKWILLSDEQVAFHNENPDANIQEVLDMQFTPRTIEQAKQEKIAQIKEYDSSDNVNSFDVIVGADTIQAWLTPDQRSNYKNSIDSAKILELDELHPIFNGVQITIPTSVAETALAQIQLYADRCFIVTETHIANVNNLSDINQIDSYDYTADYPTRLIFDLNQISQS